MVSASGFQEQCCTALGPASPSPDISILVKGKCIRKGVFSYGCTRGAQRSCQDLRAELYLTWSYTQPPWSPFPSRSWHRTPAQFILDLSVPAHFPISSFCILSFFFASLTPKLDPSVSDSFLGLCSASTQRQSCGFALRISP